MQRQDTNHTAVIVVVIVVIIVIIVVVVVFVIVVVVVVVVVVVIVVVVFNEEGSVELIRWVKKCNQDITTPQRKCRRGARSEANSARCWGRY